MESEGRLQDAMQVARRGTVEVNRFGDGALEVAAVRCPLLGKLSERRVGDAVLAPLLQKTDCLVEVIC